MVGQLPRSRNMLSPLSSNQPKSRRRSSDRVPRHGEGWDELLFGRLGLHERPRHHDPTPRVKDPPIGHLKKFDGDESEQVDFDWFNTESISGVLVVCWC